MRANLFALALAGLVSLATPVGAQQSAMTRVDLELMLAVDISQSMDYEEHSIQRQGYIDAFRHGDVINALMSGPEGKIAVMYMEWAGDFDPIPTIPWTIIDSKEAAHAFADRLEHRSRHRDHLRHDRPECLRLRSLQRHRGCLRRRPEHLANVQLECRQPGPGCRR